MNWPKFNDIFAFRPPTDPNGRLSFNREPNFLVKSAWHKIRYDNTIRLFIAIPVYLACVVLKLTGNIPSLLPMTIIFSTFSLVQLTLTWFFRNSKQSRVIDFLLCGVDLVAMSFAVFTTGGVSSPLYFIYFIPLIVHAFHRDWGLILFNGIGGILLYGFAIWHSLATSNLATYTDLGARLFFMLLTIGVACFSLNLLRKKDDVDHLRIIRLDALSQIGLLLNNVYALADLPVTVRELLKLINEGLGQPLKPWSRVFLIQRDPHLMNAISDPVNFHPEFMQDLVTSQCPAIRNNSIFHLENAEHGNECPTERFSFGSHICVPIAGTENETFGVLFVGSANPGVFLPEEKQFLEFVAKSLGLGIQRLQRMEELRRAVEMNSCVMATYIASTRSPEDALESILDGVMAMLHVDQASLLLWDGQSERLKTVKVRGPRVQDELGLEFQMGEGISGKVLEKGEAYWTANVNEDPLYKSRRSGIKCLLSLPVKSIKGNRLGVINASRIETNLGFTTEEIELALTFVFRAALFIENIVRQQAESAGRQFPDHPSRAA